jgi:Domain of unknown function (DUF1772)
MIFLTILESVATLSAGLFSGAAIYINLVEHPARMVCGTDLALREFGPSYRRATVMQSVLAATGSLTAIMAWMIGASRLWLFGGTILVAVIPFTLLVIFPTNKKLLDPVLSHDSDLAHKLLIRWGRLHAVRSGLSLTSFAMFVVAALAA